MRSIIFVLLLALGACASELPAPITAQYSNWLRLSDWVSAQTGYPMSPPPAWYVAPDNYTRGVVGASGSTEMVMLYHCPTRSIIVPRAAERHMFDGGVEGALVHELVHHGQCLAGRDMAPCEKEREAYQLSARYMREQAYRVISPPLPNWIAFAEQSAASACAGGVRTVRR